MGYGGAVSVRLRRAVARAAAADWCWRGGGAVGASVALVWYVLRVFVDGLRGCLVRGGSECRIGVVWICALFSVGCLGIGTLFWARLFGDFTSGFGRSARIFGVGRHMLVVGACLLVARCTFRWAGAHFVWGRTFRAHGRWAGASHFHCAVISTPSTDISCRHHPSGTAPGHAQLVLRDDLQRKLWLYIIARTDLDVPGCCGAHFLPRSKRGGSLHILIVSRRMFG